MKYFLLGRDSSQKRSLPSWECGLKLVLNVIYMKSCDVAPFVGVWIEILSISLISERLLSLPSWECGLKYQTKGKAGYEMARRSLRKNADSIIFYLVWVILIFINCHQYCSNDKRIYIQWKYKKGRNQ